MNVNGFTSAAAARRHLRAAGHKINTLLADPSSNPKVAKNGKVVDVLTAPLHLAPFDLSGFQVCPQASTGCAAACLHTAGNPAYMAQKDISRKAKTVAYFKERDAFLALLVFEIEAHVRKCRKLGMECGVRLNATSDLPWEIRKVTIDGYVFNLMAWFDGRVSFYDYTKITKRAIAWAEGRMPSNYHLTFSRTEGNDDDVSKVLNAGGNVAVVMSAERYKAAVQEEGWMWFVRVVDGDAHDYRPADPKGCIVALKAKGDARHDTSGFVIR
jgi:hypothetical protein